MIFNFTHTMKLLKKLLTLLISIRRTFIIRNMDNSPGKKQKKEGHYINILGWDY